MLWHHIQFQRVKNTTAPSVSSSMSTVTACHDLYSRRRVKISRAEGKLIHCLQMVDSIKFCAVRPLCALHSDSKQTERDVMTLIQDIRICQICFIFCLLSIFCKHKNISHISESEIALNPRKDLQSNFLKLLGSLLKAQAYHFLI